MIQEEKNSATATEKIQAKASASTTKQNETQKSAKRSDRDRKKTKSKNIAQEFITRIVVRQLPPTMNEEQFLEVVAPLASNSEFYYVNGDLSLGEFAFSRAYIKFNRIEDVLLFKSKWDDYVFVDQKGNEYPAIVEYAPLQKLGRVPNSINIKQDSKVNTIEQDEDFLAFKTQLENAKANGQSTPALTTEQLLKEIGSKESKENHCQTTPLVEYLNQRCRENVEKDRIRKEEIKKKKKEVREKNKKQKKQENKQKPQQQKPEQKKIIIVKKKNELPSTSKATQKPEKLTENKESDQNQKNIKDTSSSTSKKESPSNKNKNEQLTPAKKVDNPQKDSQTKSSNDNKTKIDKEKSERVRNKDRPAREIYRPGMVRQKSRQDQQTAQSTNKKESTSKDANNNNPSNHQESSANKDTGSNSSSNVLLNSQQKKNNDNNQPKYKYRVFTRTKNNN